MLLSAGIKTSAFRIYNFGAQSHSLFSRCLRLATAITDSHSRLTTGGWLELSRQASHLLDYSPFVWAHNSDLQLPILYHNSIFHSIKNILYYLTVVVKLFSPSQITPKRSYCHDKRVFKIYYQSLLYHSLISNLHIFSLRKLSYSSHFGYLCSSSRNALS